MSEFESIIDCEPMQQSDTVSGYDNKTTFEETNRNNEQEDTSPLDTLSNSNTAADSDDQHSDASFSINESHNIEVEDNLPDTETPPIQPCHVLLDSNVVTKYFSERCRQLLSMPDKKRGRPPKVLGALDCNICEKQFKYIADLRRHKACTHDTEPICKSCFKYFDTKTLLNEHECEILNGTSALSKFFSCKVCFRIYNSKANHDAHVKIHAVESNVSDLPEVTEAISQTDSIDNFNKVSSSNQELIEINPEPETSEQNINTNISEPEPDTVVVNNDKSEVNNESNIIITNIVSNVSTSHFVCDICGNMTVRAHDHRRHLARYHGTEPFCRYCNSVFYTKAEAVAHECSKNKRTRNDDSESDVICIEPPPKKNICEHQPVAVKTYSKNNIASCDICKRSFADKELLKKHHCHVKSFCQHCNTIEHVKDLVDVNSKRYCKPCATMDKLKIVPPISNIKLRCNLCSKELASKLHVKYHMAIEHSEVPYCDVCDTFFKHAGDIILHNQVFHSGSNARVPTVASSVVPKPPMLQQNMVSLQTVVNPPNKLVSQELMNVPQVNLPPEQPICAPELVMVPQINDEPEVIGISDDDDDDDDGTGVNTNNFEFVMLEENAEESTNMPTQENLISSNNDCNELIIDNIKCRLCSSKFTRIAGLKRHVKIVHNLNFLCVYCWKDVSAEFKNLLVHYNACKFYKLCRDKVKAVGVELNPQANRQAEKEKSPVLTIQQPTAVFNCKHCNVNFLTDLDCKIHMNLSHNGTFLVCHHCRLEFINIPIFVSHIHTCEKSKTSSSTDTPSVPVINEVVHIKEHTFNLI